MDTFFDDCLSEFAKIPPIRLHPDADPSEFGEHFMLWLVAKVGFRRFAETKYWTSDVDEFLSEIVNRDLLPETMRWFEETEEAVRLYACYTYGALAGKYTARELNHDQFETGVVMLPGYYFTHADAIYAAYLKGMGSHRIQSSG
jgi:hypothetical protein